MMGAKTFCGRLINNVFCKYTLHVLSLAKSSGIVDDISDTCIRLMSRERGSNRGGTHAS